MGVYKPDVIHKFATFVTKPDCIGIPLNLDPLEFGTVLSKSLNNLVHVNARLHPEEPAIGCAQTAYPEIRKGDNQQGTSHLPCPLLMLEQEEGR